MKKILAFIITTLLAVSLSGCAGQGETDGTAEAFVPTGELSAQNVIIDIANDDNGHYELLADVTVSFDDDDGMITWIAAEDAVVLAFQVSDYYEGGVYLYSGAEMDELLNALKAIAENTGVSAEELQSIIERLENGGPIEGAST